MTFYFLNPIALRKAKIVYNFDHSECNMVKEKDLILSIYLYMYEYTHKGEHSDMEMFASRLNRRLLFKKGICSPERAYSVQKE